MQAHTKISLWGWGNPGTLKSSFLKVIIKIKINSETVDINVASQESNFENVYNKVMIL